MGGGAVFRGITRIVGAATVGAAAVPTTGAFCHVHPPASSSMRQQENLSAMLNLSQKEMYDLNINSKEFPNLVDLRFEQEERECSLLDKEEGANGLPLRQLVFSHPPTLEEVEEATKELHAALHLSIPAPDYLSEDDRPESMLGISSCEENAKISPKVLDKRVTATLPSSSSQPRSHLAALAAECNSVLQAFQLLQTNPKVQDVVKSLACDPAVWNAVLSNEKVLELTKEDSHDIQEAFSIEEDQVETKESRELKESSEVTLTSKLYGYVSQRSKVYYGFVKGKLILILNSMFGSMEKTIFSKAGTSTKDKTVASCMMLAVAVLIVVVMRRRTATSYAKSR